LKQTIGSGGPEADHLLSRKQTIGFEADHWQTIGGSRPLALKQTIGSGGPLAQAA
jgi:hypothetical protein